MQDGAGANVYAAQVDGHLIHPILGGSAHTQKACSNAACAQVTFVGYDAAVKKDGRRHQRRHIVHVRRCARVFHCTDYASLSQQFLQAFPLNRGVPA